MLDFCFLNNKKKYILMSIIAIYYTFSLKNGVNNVSKRFKFASNDTFLKKNPPLKKGGGGILDVYDGST
jgi:hypothetical protein